MSILQQIIYSIITGIIASIVFYLILFTIRPRVKLSDVICISGSSDKFKIAKIKVVNLGRSMLMNVNYTLHYCVNYDDGLIDMTEIHPRKSSLSTISKYSHKNTDYAVRITYEIPNEHYPLLENAKFVFTLQVTHPLSNTSKCIKKEYCKDDLKNGEFESGKSVKFISHRGEKNSM